MARNASNPGAGAVKYSPGSVITTISSAIIASE
jgi:hypothetical protein